MNFDPSEEQRLFAASIERFVARDYTFEARRSIVASHDGYSRDVWAAFAELGMLGVAIPTEYGGLGGGAVDLTSVMEAIGEALIVEPYLATVMGARLVALAGTVEQKNSLLPAVAEGKATMAFAHSEQGARYDLAHVATRARKTGAGFTIDGPKGPRYEAKMGSVLLAKKTGFPILPFTITAKRFWEVKKSWDQSQIPKPFTRARVFIATPIYVAPDADDKALEARRAELQAALDDIDQRGEEWRVGK